MNSKQRSGVLGMTIGGIWLLINLRHVGTQGLVALGMPIVLLVLGVIYFRSGAE